MADGVVYVSAYEEASYAKALYAFDAASGALLWSWSEAETAFIFPSNKGNLVLASGLFMWESPELHYDSSEADDGVVFASKQALTADPDTPYSSLAVAEGVVYLVARYDGIYALDAATGNLVWHFDDNKFGYLAGLWAAPAVVDGIVYAGAFNRNYDSGAEGSVIALDAETGKQLWHDKTAGGQFDTPAAAEGIVYASAHDGHLYANNAATGDLFWHYSLGEQYPSAQAVVDGVVYAGSWDEHVYAIDSATGELLWRYAKGEGFSSLAPPSGVAYAAERSITMPQFEAFTGPAVAAGVVYIGSWDGHLYALDAASGKPIWRS